MEDGDDRYAALDARLDGLRIVLGVALQMVPNEREVAQRLRRVETELRTRNARSETIAEVREFREKWEA